jgi:alkanesulfonate monooxygenase SsuD/methylene tetrahydromethanopterin reductase-like flavin-dependent oxidoreductase (luciferase family)
MPDTAKWVATIQERSEGRLHLGVGSGWMRAEFRAVGVDWHRRGAITDATLEFLQRCFANEVVESNGQPFLFKPRPARPPIFVGGAPPHALRRSVRYGDGWMPHAADPQSLKPSIEALNQQMADAGRGKAEVAVLTTLPLGDPVRVDELVGGFREVGATRVIHGWRYQDATEFIEVVAKMRRIANLAA